MEYMECRVHGTWYFVFKLPGKMVVNGLETTLLNVVSDTKTLYLEAAHKVLNSLNVQKHCKKNIRFYIFLKAKCKIQLLKCLI